MIVHHFSSHCQNVYVFFAEEQQRRKCIRNIIYSPQTIYFGSEDTALLAFLLVIRGVWTVNSFDRTQNCQQYIIHSSAMTIGASFFSSLFSLRSESLNTFVVDVCLVELEKKRRRRSGKVRKCKKIYTAIGQVSYDYFSHLSSPPAVQCSVSIWIADIIIMKRYITLNFMCHETSKSV